MEEGTKSLLREYGEVLKSAQYGLVPKERAANLRYRERVMRIAGEAGGGTAAADVRGDLWTACARYILFYINTFCWLYEPRVPAIYPFVTWGYQDRVILRVSELLGKRDILIEKSRD